MTRQKRILAVMASALCIRSAFGYIDPGTGGLIVSSAGSTIATVCSAVGAFLLAYLVKPFRRRIQALWRAARRGGR